MTQRYGIVYAASARLDVIAIGDYLRKVADDDVAEKFVGRIIAAVDSLAVRPLRRRIRTELGPDIRSLNVGQHLIFFRAEGGAVEIVRVLHGSRKITADLFST